MINEIKTKFTQYMNTKYNMSGVYIFIKNLKFGIKRVYSKKYII